MPKLNKISSGNDPSGKASTSKTNTKLKPETVDRARKKRWTVFIIASVVVVAILATIGISSYFSEDARYKRLTLITVDDISIKMDYFLRRTQMADADAMAMLDALTNEQLIKLGAPGYVTEVISEDVDQELREIASGESEPISEDEFKEWYRQLLNEIDFSDSEYREMVATSLTAARLQEYLAERVPTVAEQIHLHSVLLSTEDMQKITEGWGEEEHLSELIAEVWLDKQSEEKTEDLGWLPRGVLPLGFDEAAFNLNVGDVSEPLAYTSDPTSTEIFYYLFMVAEKADAREIEENALQILQANALEPWLLEETRLHEIEWNFNSKIYDWINWQLSKE